MAIPASQMNFPLTTFSLTDNASNTATLSAAELVIPSITPTVIVDSTTSIGTEGQILTCDASSALVWANPAATPNIAQVLAVEVDGVSGNANNQPLTNIQRLGFYSVAQTSGIKGGLNGQLVISTAGDSGTTRQFARVYLPISIGNDDTKLYYLPLFEALP